MEWEVLLYGDRIQLVNWIITEKYTYWAQGISLPASMEEKIRKLAYKLIWDRRKGISWSQLPNDLSQIKESVRDLSIISKAISVKRDAKFWEKRELHPGTMDLEKTH